MQFVPKFVPGPEVCYPESEKPALASLENLFRDWHQHFAGADWPDAQAVADDMVFDGFYPHYFNQAKRILFIARESRDIPGANYINQLIEAYRNKKPIGKRYINGSKFHRLMIRIAYGVRGRIKTSHQRSK